MHYLGASLAADGFCDNELSRRIGMAKADFRSLMKVWRHSNLPWQRKLHVYASLVESKFLYGLSTVCLTKPQQRRLNGFQNRCLRTILGIKSAFICRVSNADVLTKSGHTLASTLLLQKQLQLFGKVLRSTQGDTLNVVSFIQGTTHPATERYSRRVGRPRKEWIPELTQQAVRLMGNMTNVTECARQPLTWKSVIQSKFKQ